MPPQDRRASLAAAALPLVCQYGTKVTTRQLADAAGVAEGTIFRVFRDKDELVQAAITEAVDAAPILRELERVDAALPLRLRLMEVVSILQRRVQLIVNLMVALGMSAPPEEVAKRREAVRHSHGVVTARIGELLEPDREEFRCPVGEVVRMMRLVTFAGSHPVITDGQSLPPEELVDLLLDGVRRRSGNPPPSREDRAC